MKPILAAGILALGIHGLLFSLDFNWLGKSSLKHPVPLVLNMTLTSINANPTPHPAPKNEPVSTQKTMGRKREKPVPKKQTAAPKSKKPVFKKKTVTEKKKEPVLKKKIVIKKSKPQPKHVKSQPLNKAPSPKPVQVPLQPKTSNSSKASAEQTDETTTASDLIPDKNGAKTVSKFIEHDGASLSPLETIHEAKPAYRSNPSPKYPRIARIRGFQGNVLLEVLVNADGRVDDIKISKSSGYPVLDRSAESTVKQWLFEPGRIGKRKIDMWVRVPIRFKLTD
jgi:periplasmic protein TonB